MNSLGVLLEDSDPEQARRWLERAAEAGDADAMNRLGVLLEDSDPEQARHWLEQAAEADGVTEEDQPKAEG
jgi:TPR repeat protein